MKTITLNNGFVIQCKPRTFLWEQLQLEQDDPDAYERLMKAHNIKMDKIAERNNRD